jgi:hypothetical protein
VCFDSNTEREGKAMVDKDKIQPQQAESRDSRPDARASRLAESVRESRRRLRRRLRRRMR